MSQYLSGPVEQSLGVMPLFNSDDPLDARRTNQYTPLTKNWPSEKGHPPQSMTNWPPEKESMEHVKSREISTLSAEWNACFREQSTLSMEVAPFGERDSHTQCTIAQMKELMDSHGTNESSILQKEYHGSVGLCKRLCTSPSHGNSFEINIWILNFLENLTFVLTFDNINSSLFVLP